MEHKKATEYTLKATSNYIPSERMYSSTDAVKFARQFYHDDICIYESSFILLLNQANMVIGWAKISQGGLTSVVVDVRLIAKIAIDALATGVVFVHNHPSGNMKASPQDIALSKRISEGLALLDIRLLDSIIIGPDQSKFYSCNDEGDL